MEEKLIAGWEYDLFPYVLMGEVAKQYSNGNVMIKGYPSSVVAPLFVIPEEQGREIKLRIAELTSEYTGKKAQLHADYKGQVDQLIGHLK